MLYRRGVPSLLELPQQFFDNGVAQHLQNRKEVTAGTPVFGVALEAYVFHELKTYIDYEAPSLELFFCHTTTDIEIDFILDDRVAIEVKASSLVSAKDLKELKAFRKESSHLKRFIVACLEPAPRNSLEMEGLPNQAFTFRQVKSHLLHIVTLNT